MLIRFRVAHLARDRTQLLPYIYINRPENKSLGVTGNNDNSTIFVLTMSVRDRSSIVKKVICFNLEMKGEK